MPKRARKTSDDEGTKGKGNAQNRDEPECTSPTTPKLTAYSSRHPQVVLPLPCSTLRAAKRVKKEDNGSPIGDNMATPVDGTLPGANDVSNSEKADSTFRPRTQGSEDCHSAAASAYLNNVINSIVTSGISFLSSSIVKASNGLFSTGATSLVNGAKRIVRRSFSAEGLQNTKCGKCLLEGMNDKVLPQALSAVAGHSRYPFRHARSVPQKRASLRLAVRIKKNETFTDSATESVDGYLAAESVDGSTPMIENVPEVESSPQEHRLEESNLDPPLEHFNSTTDNFVPTVAAPAACMRIKRNETFIDSVAESIDGSTPMIENVPIVDNSPQEHILEESYSDPPSDHLNSTTDKIMTQVAAPAACISNNCDQTTVRDAEIEPTYIETRLEVCGDSNQSNVRLARSLSFNFSEMADLMDDGSSSQSEVGFRGHPLVTVEGYRVKEEVAPILRCVLSKHGDIAAKSSFQHLKIRSSLLEHTCDIIHELQELEFAKVSISALESMRALVDELKNHLDVSWLGKRLDDIIEARQLVKQSPSWIEARKKNKLDIEEIEKENEDMIEKLRVNNMKLASLKTVTTTINTTFSEAKVKLKCFYRRSLVEDLI